MRLLIILPNWLGDAVMATPAIEAIADAHPDAAFTFVGSFASIEALKHHPLCRQAYVDPTKKSRNRLLNTYRFAKELGRFDSAVSFRNNFFSSLLLYLTKTKTRLVKKSWFSPLLATRAAPFLPDEHLVLSYLRIVSPLIGKEPSAGHLKLHIPPQKSTSKSLGINPGATYGSAKRWYPERFAQVAKAFSDTYEIIIFGGPSEVSMGEEIASRLDELGVTNYLNLAGKTTIESLCARIGGLSLFVTNDSGPMHIAAAYQVPTVAIFGPTRYLETSQWANEYSAIIRHDIPCAPCMKRTCPLKHHECMASITSDEVIASLKDLQKRAQQADRL